MDTLLAAESQAEPQRILAEDHQGHRSAGGKQCYIGLVWDRLALVLSAASHLSVTG